MLYVQYNGHTSLNIFNLILSLLIILFEYIYIYIYLYNIQVLPTDTVGQLVERRRDMPKDLGWNPSECHIFYLFRCVLSFSAILAKRLKVQF